MSDQSLYSAWFLSLVLLVVVVLIAAALLIALLLTARSILRHAREALSLAERISADTHPIWDLAQTNEVAGEILGAATSIETHGAALVETLHEPRAVAG